MSPLMSTVVVWAARLAAAVPYVLIVVAALALGLGLDALFGPVRDITPRCFACG